MESYEMIYDRAIADIDKKRVNRITGREKNQI